jgi:type I restriction enzyme S subunit
MNAEQLLQHFERISEAPDAIPRLRRFIFDLAVRGKLVEQDPSDEPAAELLRWIKAEKASRRSARGSIRTEEEVERWCTIPATWDFVRLDEVCNVVMGSSPPGSTYNKNGEGVPLINGPVEFTPGPFGRTVINQYTTAPSAYCNEGDFLICVRGSTTGRTNIAAFRGCIGRGVAAIQPLFEDQFIRLAIRVRQEAILQMGRGIAFPSISREQLAGLPVPLPPLAEQHRIVAKVDELMSLCDQLESAKAEREKCRDSLVAASLQGLRQPVEEEETFREHAHFTFNNLPRITTRAGHINQLRQTILNLAVRGKLVPQDPSDEPASELLRRIAVERRGLTKGGKAKKEVKLPEPDLDQAPFDLPSGWVWGRFPELGTFGRGKSKHRPRNDAALFEGGEHLLIQTGDVARSRGVIETYTNKYNDFGLSQSLKWPCGTLCITIAANIADSGILSFDACFPDSVVGFVPASMFNNARYFEYFVRTAKANLLEFAPATAQKNINLEILTQVLIPLPPLSEQNRIVAKVDELMMICDQLEAQITGTEQDSRRFLEAVLTEALSPALVEAE